MTLAALMSEWSVNHRAVEDADVGKSSKSKSMSRMLARGLGSDDFLPSPGSPRSPFPPPPYRSPFPPEPPFPPMPLSLQPLSPGLPLGLPPLLNPSPVFPSLRPEKDPPKRQKSIFVDVGKLHKKGSSGWFQMPQTWLWWLPVGRRVTPHPRSVGITFIPGKFHIVYNDVAFGWPSPADLRHHCLQILGKFQLFDRGEGNGGSRSAGYHFHGYDGLHRRHGGRRLLGGEVDRLVLRWRRRTAHDGQVPIVDGIDCEGPFLRDDVDLPDWQGSVRPKVRRWTNVGMKPFRIFLLLTMITIFIKWFPGSQSSANKFKIIICYSN